MKRLQRTERFWAIEWTPQRVASRAGPAPQPRLYCGTYLTRAAAIEDHTRLARKTWPQCQARGDRAVRVTVYWETLPPPPRPRRLSRHHRANAARWAARRRLIAWLHAGGLTPAQIARHEGVSRERVRQILLREAGAE